MRVLTCWVKIASTSCEASRSRGRRVSPDSRNSSSSSHLSLVLTNLWWKSGRLKITRIHVFQGLQKNSKHTSTMLCHIHRIYMYYFNRKKVKTGTIRHTGNFTQSLQFKFNISNWWHHWSTVSAQTVNVMSMLHSGHGYTCTVLGKVCRLEVINLCTLISNKTIIDC